MSGSPLMRQLSTLFQRAWLFARDYCDEFGIAWSLARHRDCERNGGHRWGAPYDDGLGWAKHCSRCGTAETIAKTCGTATTNATTIEVKS